jgi:hypothetical protein
MAERLAYDIAADLRRQTELSDATLDLLCEAAGKLEGLVDLLAKAENARDELGVLLPVGRMYLDAIDNDPEHELLTLPQAIGITYVRNVVEAWDAERSSTTVIFDEAETPRPAESLTSSPAGKELRHIDCAQQCDIPDGVTMREMPPSRHAWSDIVRCPNDDCGRTFMVIKDESAQGGGE